MNFRVDYTEKKIPRKAKKDKISGKVSVKGKNVVVTGRIPGMTRAQAENFIFRHGGHFYASISNSTTLLINGNPASKSTTKLEVAQEMNIPIITPRQIAELNR